MATITDVITAVEQYSPKADFETIQRAYKFSAEAHGEQKRLSGIPYVSHPVAVAHILTQLKMDSMTIASALLHDTIEDTDTTESSLTTLFGQEVATLVVGVTAGETRLREPGGTAGGEFPQNGRGDGQRYSGHPD